MAITLKIYKGNINKNQYSNQFFIQMEKQVFLQRPLQEAEALIISQCEKIAEFVTVLVERHPSPTIEDVLNFAQQPDLERQQAIEEAQAYITSTGMPTHLQAATIASAKASVPQDYINRLTALTDVFDGITSKDLKQSADGSIVLSKAYCDRVKERARFTYTPEQEELLKTAEEFIVAGRKLKDRVRMDMLQFNYLSFDGDLQKLPESLPLMFLRYEQGV